MVSVFDNPARSAASLIDDRPEEEIFRVNRAAFTDQAVFAQEMSEIFEKLVWAKSPCVMAKGLSKIQKKIHDSSWNH